jgi:hypothetical protein
MDQVVERVANSLEETPEQWIINIVSCAASASHPSGIRLELYEIGVGRSSFIQLDSPHGGTHTIGFWAKQRLWALLEEAVKKTLDKRAKDRLDGFKFCPYCGRPVVEKPERGPAHLKEE